MNEERFEEIFWEVAEKKDITNWWELFDSEEFDEVEQRITEEFKVEDAAEVEGFIKWYNIMAGEL